jgi:hypothetical protein
VFDMLAERDDDRLTGKGIAFSKDETGDQLDFVSPTDAGSFMMKLGKVI